MALSKLHDREPSVWVHGIVYKKVPDVTENGKPYDGLNLTEDNCKKIVRDFYLRDNKKNGPLHANLKHSSNNSSIIGAIDDLYYHDKYGTLCSIIQLYSFQPGFEKILQKLKTSHDHIGLSVELSFSYGQMSETTGEIVPINDVKDIDFNAVNVSKIRVIEKKLNGIGIVDIPDHLEDNTFITSWHSGSTPMGLYEKDSRFREYLDSGNAIIEIKNKYKPAVTTPESSEKREEVTKTDQKSTRNTKSESDIDMNLVATFFPKPTISTGDISGSSTPNNNTSAPNVPSTSIIPTNGNEPLPLSNTISLNQQHSDSPNNNNVLPLSNITSATNPLTNKDFKKNDSTLNSNSSQSFGDISSLDSKDKDNHPKNRSNDMSTPESQTTNNAVPPPQSTNGGTSNPYKDMLNPPSAQAPDISDNDDAKINAEVERRLKLLMHQQQQQQNKESPSRKNDGSSEQNKNSGSKRKAPDSIKTNSAGNADSEGNESQKNDDSTPEHNDGDEVEPPPKKQKTNSKGQNVPREDKSSKNAPRERNESNRNNLVMMGTASEQINELLELEGLANNPEALGAYVEKKREKKAKEVIATQKVILEQLEKTYGGSVPTHVLEEVDQSFKDNTYKENPLILTMAAAAGATNKQAVLSHRNAEKFYQMTKSSPRGNYNDLPSMYDSRPKLSDNMPSILEYQKRREAESIWKSLKHGHHPPQSPLPHGGPRTPQTPLQTNTPMSSEESSYMDDSPDEQASMENGDDEPVRHQPHNNNNNNNNNRRVPPGQQPQSSSSRLGPKQQPKEKVLTPEEDYNKRMEEYIKDYVGGLKREFPFSNSVHRLDGVIQDELLKQSSMPKVSSMFGNNYLQRAILSRPRDEIPQLINYQLYHPPIVQCYTEDFLSGGLSEMSALPSLTYLEYPSAEVM